MGNKQFTAEQMLNINKTLGAKPERSTDIVAPGTNQRNLYENSEDTKSFGEKTGDIAKELIVDPVTSLGANLGIIGAKTLGHDDTANNLAEFERNKGLEARGPSYDNPNLPEEESMLMTVGQYVSPSLLTKLSGKVVGQTAKFIAGAEEAAIPKTLGLPEVAGKTATVAEDTVESAAKKTSDNIISNIKNNTENLLTKSKNIKGDNKVKAIKDFALVEGTGTLATTPLYDIDHNTNEVKVADDYLERTGTMLAANAIPSALLSAGIFSKSIHADNQITNAMQEILNKANNTELNLNINKVVMNNIRKKTNDKVGVIPADDLSLEKLKSFNKNNTGLYKTSDGNYIMSTPKLGAFKVGRRKDGSWHTIPDKSNYFTIDGLSTSERAGDKLRPIFSFNSSEINVGGKNELTFNPFETVKLSTTAEGVSGVATLEAAGIPKDLTEHFNTIINALDEEGTSLKPNSSTVTVEQTPAQVLTAAIQKGVAKDAVKKLEDSNPFLRQVAESARNLNFNRNKLFESSNIDNASHMLGSKVQNDIRKFFSTISKDNPLRDIVDAMVNRNNNKSIFLKDDVLDAISSATDSAIADMTTKIVKDESGNYYMPKHSVSDLASTIASRVVENTGIVKDGLTTQQLAKELAEQLQENQTALQNLGETSTFKNADGSISNGYAISKKAESIDKKGIRIESATEDKLTSFGDVLFKNSKDISKGIANAKEYKKSYNKLNSINNKKKYSTRYDNQNNKVPRAQRNLTQEQFLSELSKRLDKDSLPLSTWVENGKIHLGNDAQAYVNMANTRFYYSGGVTKSLEFVNSILSMGDLELAKFLKLLPEEATSIDKFTYMNWANEDLMANLKAVRDEAQAHNYALTSGEYNANNGMTFSVSKVSTTRMTYMGVINPQQGRLSKYLYTKDNTFKKGYEDSYKASSIRATLDELYSDIKSFLSDKLIKDIESELDTDAAKFKVEFWKANDETVLDIGNKLYNELSNSSYKPTDIKALTAYRSLMEGFGKGNVQMLRNEVDGVTSANALSNGYMKVVNQKTGIGDELSASGLDTYEALATSISNSRGFEFANFSDDKDIIQSYGRNLAKIMAQGGSYGQTANNIGIGFIHEFLNQSVRKGEFLSSIEGYNKALKNVAGFEYPDFNNVLSHLKTKLQKEHNIEHVKDLLEAIEDTMVIERKWIKGKNKTNITDALSLINKIDNIESLGMKVSSDNLKKIEEIDMLTGMKDALLVNNFITKVDNKLFAEILPEEIEASAKIYVRNKSGVIEKGLHEAFGEDFATLRETTNDIFKKGYIATRVKLNKTSVTDGLAKKIISELNVKPDTANSINLAISSGSIKNLFELSEALSMQGYDVLTSASFYKELPYTRNGFGDKIVYVRNDSTSFDTPTGLQYKGLTSISNALPYLLHSTDASIIGHVSKNSNTIWHRWDALYGQDAIQQAGHANDAVGYLYSKVNIFDEFKTSYTSSQKIINEAGDELDDIIRDSAARELISNNASLSAEAIDNAAKTMKNSVLDSESHMFRDISELKDNIDTKIKGIEDFKIQQYTNGSKETLGEYSSKDLNEKDFVSKNFESNYIRSSFDKDRLSNVEYEDHSVREMQPFEMTTASHTSLAEDIASAELGLNSVYETVGGSVTLAKKANQSGFWQELSHELVHHVGTKIFTPKHTHETFAGLVNKLEDKGFKVGFKDKYGVSVFTGSLLEKQSGISRIDTEHIYGNEMAASMLDRLIANELVNANQLTVASILNKKDLSNEISSLAMVKPDGTVDEMFTISDLTSFLEAQGLDTYTKDINTFANRTLGLINGSTKIRGYIHGKEKTKFESTINTFGDKIKVFNKLISKTNDKVEDIGALELFRLSPEKEVMQKVLAAKQAVEKEIDSIVPEFVEALEDDLLNRFGHNEATNVGNKLGSALLLGVNKLFYKNVAHKDFQFLNMSRNDLIVNGSLMDKDSIQRLFTSKINELYDVLGQNSSNPLIVKEMKKVKREIEQLGDGVSGVTVSQVGKRINNIIKHNMGEEAVTYVDGKLIAQKAASMHIIGKRPHSFNDLYNTINGHESVLDDYMKLANEHENPYTLFGDNVEPIFVEDGRSAKIIMSGEVHDPKDVIGHITDTDGNQYQVISYNTDTRRIAGQDSNLIDADIKDMEKGLFQQNGLTLTGQAMDQQGSPIEKSITKQLGRNMYIKKNADISNDLAYRSWAMLRDNNILLTKEEAENIKKIKPNTEMILLSKDNPITNATGVQYYYDKAYQHYFEGSSGLDIRGMSRRVAGDTELAKVIEQGTFITYNLVKALKGLVLVARPQSYINSFVSSMTIYATHAQGFDYVKDMKVAGAASKKFSNDINKYAKILIDPNKKQEAKDFYSNNIENSLFNEMILQGIVNTIRTDLYRMNSIKQFEGYTAIRRSTDKQTADMVKTFLLDPSTPLGNKLSELFDLTELRPKMMLYINAKNKYMAKGKTNKEAAELAGQTVVMAFPTYYNLNPVLNAVDMVSPYTKFLASSPRNILYGVNQNPKRMAAGYGIAHTVVPASYMFTEDNQGYDFYEDKGFIKLPGVDYGYYSHSLFPIWANPLDNPFSESGGIDPFFLPNVVGSMSKPSTYIPGTSMKVD